MSTNDPVTDVGVIIGRFQVDELHEGHLQLIKSVFDKHDKVLIFLGLSPIKCTHNNPLDFESRKQMLQDKFSSANILYIKDMNSDVEWSKRLDEQIKDVTGPTQTVTLYGSRDSFIKYYHGKHSTSELEQTVFTCGSDIRKGISNRVKASPEFRAGVIWATGNQYINATPCIDLAIFNKEMTKILLGRKMHEKKYRFIGGHVDSGESFEEAARREGHEETNLEIGDVLYVSSLAIKDWRHKKEKSGITTAFFYTKDIISGKPEPHDDIEELKWFELQYIDLLEILVPEHIKLANLLEHFKIILS